MRQWGVCQSLKAWLHAWSHLLPPQNGFFRCPHSYFLVPQVLSGFCLSSLTHWLLPPSAACMGRVRIRQALTPQCLKQRMVLLNALMQCLNALPWALLLFEGSALEQGKRWDEARAVLEKAAIMAPNEPVILNYLGYAQIERRQNVDAALDLLKKASALKPQDASITDSLGWAKFVTGDVNGAVPVLERAAAGAPGDATINEHLGDALWTAGRRYEARYAWRAAAVFAEGDVANRLAAKAREGLKPEYAAP